MRLPEIEIRKRKIPRRTDGTIKANILLLNLNSINNEIPIVIPDNHSNTVKSSGH
jgi:hypothetical protein